MVREAKNVTPDTGCCKAINPDIALGIGLGPDASMAQAAVPPTQTSRASRKLLKGRCVMFDCLVAGANVAAAADPWRQAGRAPVF